MCTTHPTCRKWSTYSSSVPHKRSVHHPCLISHPQESSNPRRPARDSRTMEWEWAQTKIPATPRTSSNRISKTSRSTICSDWRSRIMPPVHREESRLVTHKLQGTPSKLRHLSPAGQQLRMTTSSRRWRCSSTNKRQMRDTKISATTYRMLVWIRV